MPIRLCWVKNEAVADQHVVAHALEIGDVLDAHGLRPGTTEREREGEEPGCECQSDLLLNRKYRGARHSPDP
jgi:hypothetical protein